MIPPSDTVSPLISPLTTPVGNQAESTGDLPDSISNTYFPRPPTSPRRVATLSSPHAFSSKGAGRFHTNLVNGTRRTPRRYSESSTFSDTSASSGGLFLLPSPSLRTQTFFRHPAGPAGNPKLNNYALQGIWDIYRKEAGDYDAGMIDSWNATIDNLILFAGLFSGIITGFLTESYKSLHQPVPSELNPEGKCEMFGCGPHAVRINTVWFASLALSLASALIAMIAKQWIAGYKVELLFSGTGCSEWFHDACRVRQFRYDGLSKYKMAQVIAATPILLHTAIWCFCIGIIDFLWTINRTVAIPFTCLCGLTFSFYVGSTISAVVSPRSPFKTALARLICHMRKAKPERDFVEGSGTLLDKAAVEWLISNSRNQDIHNEAVKALFELKAPNPNE